MENQKISQDLTWPLTDIVNGKVNQLYKIDKDSPFYFKLTDQSKIMRKVQRHMKDKPELNALYGYHYNFTKALKQNVLWLKTETGIISMTLYDVYSALMKHLRDATFEDQLFNCNQVSFVGPLGPFRDMPLVQCLNQDTIDKFIFDQILKNKLPLRKRRILTSSQVIMEYGGEFQYKSKLKIKQISENGLLFAMNDSIILDLMAKGEYVKLFVDTRNLVSFTENKLRSQKKFNDDFFYTEDELRYAFVRESDLIKSLSYNSGDTNEVYFFCRFSDMRETDIPNSFYDFFNVLNDYFDQLT